MIVPQPLQRHGALAEESLRAVLSQHPFPLYHLMEYQLGWRDEQGAPLEVPGQQNRLYAGLCLLACQTMGNGLERALVAAAAVELIDQFSRVHADIQDGSQHRNGRPTVWWIWGPAQAINAGDGLHALGRLSLLRLRDEGVSPEETLSFLSILDSACLRMCEGLHQDLVFQDRAQISPDPYVQMAREKVGALLGASLELGALAGGCSAEAGQVFRLFGEDLGVALQIQEDIQAIWGEPVSGKPKGTDILNKKKGYPIICAIEEAPIAQKRELGTLFFKRVLEPQDLDHVISLLDGLDARPQAQQVAQQLYEQAVARLEGLDLIPAGQQDLIEVARWLALREGTA